MYFLINNHCYTLNINTLDPFKSLNPTKPFYKLDNKFKLG